MANIWRAPTANGNDVGITVTTASVRWIGERERSGSTPVPFTSSTAQTTLPTVHLGVHPHPREPERRISGPDRALSRTQFQSQPWCHVGVQQRVLDEFGRPCPSGVGERGYRPGVVGVSDDLAAAVAVGGALPRRLRPPLAES